MLSNKRHTCWVNKTGHFTGAGDFTRSSWAALGKSCHPFNSHMENTMADHCSFCDTRRPEGGTKMLVLNGGSFWAEFCTDCGNSVELTNEDTGETVTPLELFNRCAEE